MTKNLFIPFINRHNKIEKDRSQRYGVLNKYGQ